MRWTTETPKGSLVLIQILWQMMAQRWQLAATQKYGAMAVQMARMRKLAATRLQYLVSF
jgi:hypothetical protein